MLRPPAAANPVTFIHKAGAKTDSVVGDPSLFGARDASGQWEPQDPVSDPRTGAVTYGAFIEVTTYPTRELRDEELGRVTPGDHKAILAGDLWVAWLSAGEQAGKSVFVPTPQTVATRLGGRVIQVWP
jgi:hypothetical protein